MSSLKLSYSNNWISINYQILIIRENIETVYEKPVMYFGNPGRV
jgi:putative transposon-encoded protein